MNLQEILSNIPDEPVDGYVVEYWQLSMTEAWIYINKNVATYYINTPWRKYKPNDSTRGAPLINTWMVSSNSTPQGRIPQWEGIQKITSVNNFATEKEAAQEAIMRLDEYIKNTYRKMGELESRREQMVNRLTECASV